MTCLDAGSIPADSTYTIPITFKYNILGIFYFIYVHYLYGYNILNPKNFPAYLIT